MSLVKPAGFLLFMPPPDLDVVAYNLYFRDTQAGGGQTGPLNYNDDHINLDPTSPAITPATGEGNEGKLQIDLSVATAGMPLPNDTVVLFGLSAVDDANNESDISEGVPVPFDQVAPAAPTGLEFVPAS